MAVKKKKKQKPKSTVISRSELMAMVLRQKVAK